MFRSKIKNTVPEKYPFGGITDGNWVCSRCGEPKTGCELCAGMNINLVQSDTNVLDKKYRQFGND